jgi:basic membrane protein A and related proteins
LVSAEMRKRVDVAKAFIISGKIKVVDYTVAKSCR